MSTWPFWMNGSRLADTVSVQVMPSSAMPSSAATILATSTSKPSGELVCGLSRPKPGWSNLVPMVISPAPLSSAIVVPASNSTSSATVGAGGSSLAAGSAAARADRGAVCARTGLVELGHRRAGLQLDVLGDGGRGGLLLRGLVAGLAGAG